MWQGSESRQRNNGVFLNNNIILSQKQSNIRINFFVCFRFKLSQKQTELLTRIMF